MFEKVEATDFKICLDVHQSKSREIVDIGAFMKELRLVLTSLLKCNVELIEVMVNEFAQKTSEGHYLFIYLQTEVVCSGLKVKVGAEKAIESSHSEKNLSMIKVSIRSLE